MSRALSLLINIGLLLGSIFFVVAVGEIGLRITGIEKGHVVPPPIYQKSANPDISYELKPQLRERAFRTRIITDSRGFRSPEVDPQKPSVVVLGDSITFGYGVENDETLPALLQESLPEYNVINAGVPGYNLVQQRTTYETKLKQLSPKALILVFYWNDLKDMEPAVLAPDGNLYPQGQIPPPASCAPITTGIMGIIPGKCWLDTHSAIYRVMKKLVIQKTIKREQKEQEVQFANDLEYEYLPEENLQKYAEELSKLQDILPPDMQRLFVIWPERPLHHAMRPKLKKIAEDRGFKLIDLYDTLGHDAETLPWDTVHPSAATLSRAAKTVQTAIDYHETL